jgi:hypothetical protein
MVLWQSQEIVKKEVEQYRLPDHRELLLSVEPGALFGDTLNIRDEETDLTVISIFLQPILALKSSLWILPMVIFCPALLVAALSWVSGTAHVR